MLWSHARTSEEAWYASVFSTAEVTEAVQIAEVTYEVRGASVYTDSKEVSGPDRIAALRLAYQKLYAARSPQLALEGTAPEELTYAAAQLKEVGRLLATRQHTSRDAALMEHLYPIDLLAVLSETERLRQAFVTSGSAADAARYEERLAALFGVFEKSLSAFEAALKEAVPPKTATFAVPSALISRDTTLKAVATLRATLAQEHAEFMRRQACTRGSSAHCAHEDLLYASIATSTAPTVSTLQATLSREILRATKEVPFTFAKATDQRLILLSKKICTISDATGAPLFAMRELPTVSGETRLAPLYAGNWYFIRSTGIKEASVPYLESFSRRGIAYAPIHPGIYYECPESGTEAGAVSATLDVYVLASTEPLSEEVPVEERRPLLALEKNLIHSPYIRQADAEAYLAAAHILRTEGKLTDGAAQKVQRLTLRMREGSDGLLSTIWDIVEAERANIRAAESGIAMDFSPLNYFLTRSAFLSLNMGPYFESRGMATPFEPNTLPVERQPYALYSTERGAALDTASLGKLLSLYRQYYEL